MSVYEIKGPVVIINFIEAIYYYIAALVPLKESQNLYPSTMN